MSKWCGKIGFTDTAEIEPGLWVTNGIIERLYYGDVTGDRWKRTNANNNINDNIDVSNQISIVADPYAVDHVSKITWVEFSNEKWKVSNVEVQRPRLILSLGGVYNG